MKGMEDKGGKKELLKGTRREANSINSEFKGLFLWI